MKYYVNTNTDGTMGFYIEGVSETIPSTSIEITEGQWQDAISNQGKYSISNGAFLAALVWPPVQTAEQKIVVLDAKYKPQFEQITQAYLTAVTAGDTAAANARQADYTNLRAVYQTELEAIG
ncbi:Hypothetical protein LUCI_4955 [Lucifera butyrica]|uniref:Uncharacterized protein n=1 Tax=Lucifera butyrica TaxID=1351585 RepID=A0A498RFC9_9FIRM|nr:hypothetical protein [Lucifera butyrica]VBB09657.1 Hypothetical protein LUCI_4955 [Lucifera butyrica]